MIPDRHRRWLILLMASLLFVLSMFYRLMGTFKLIALWFDPLRFATLSAFVISVGTAGNITAATPLVLLVQSIGWRLTFTVFSVINLLLVLLFFIVVRDRPQSVEGGDHLGAASTNLREILVTLRLLFREKDYWIISLGTFCRYGIVASVQALWAGPYLMSVIGVSAVSAGNLILLMSIGK